MPFSIRIAMEPIITAAIRISMLIIAPFFLLIMCFQLSFPTTPQSGQSTCGQKNPAGFGLSKSLILAPPEGGGLPTRVEGR